MRTPPSLLLAAAAAAGGAAAEWCWEPPLARRAAAEPGADFRGSYRDLSLYHVAKGQRQPRRCAAILPAADVAPVAGPASHSGLWVLELASPEAADAAARRVERVGLPVLLRRNNSLVVQGGEVLPARADYDACGAEPGVSVVAVPARAVRPPRPLPARDAARLRRARWRRSPHVERAVDLVSQASAAGHISALQDHHSRNSYATGARDAQAWIADRYAEYGFNVTLFPFRDDMPPCVIGELRGATEPDKVIVVGAHYDSRSTDTNSATQRAPGADDNASGNSALLEIARVVSALALRLGYTLRVAAFSGEEQGLLGSRALAAAYAEQGQDIVAMLNADMLGWQIPGQPITLGFKDRYIDEEVTEMVRGLVTSYVPGLRTDYSSSCCSDYQSFHENGYTAVGFFENAVAASAYPHYHQSTDLLEYVNTEQLTLEIKALVATALTFTGVEG